MSKSFEQLMAEARKLPLTPEEKAAVRSTLIVLIAEHPVRIPAPVRQVYQRSNFFEFRRLTFNYMYIILIITLLIGGSASFAAENALPGDALYPVKVNINEKVRGGLAVSAGSEAAWQTRAAERRLVEAEKLAAQGELKADVEARLAANFKAHADRAEAAINQLTAEGKLTAVAEAAADFEATLKAHASILARLGAGAAETKAAVDVIVLAVNAKSQSATKERHNAEAKLSAGAAVQVEAAARGKLRAAQNKIAEVRAFIERVKAAVGAEATAQAEARLKAADGLVAEGEAKLSAKAYGDAFILFSRAERVAQEAKLLVNAGVDLKVKLQPTDFTVEINESASASGGGSASGASSASSQGSGSASGNAGANAEAEASLQASLQSKLREVEGRLVAVINRLQAEAAKLQATVKAEAEARVEASKKAVAEAKAKITAKAYAEADTLMQKVADAVERVELLLKGGVDASASAEVKADAGVSSGRSSGGATGSGSSGVNVNAGTAPAAVQGSVQSGTGVKVGL